MTTAIITTKPLAIVKTMASDNPDPVFWPDGSATHGTSPGYSVGKWQFVSLKYDDQPNEFYEAGPEATLTDISGGVLHVARNWQPRDATAVKAILLTRINDAAEAQRQTYITAGSGQAMVYLQKQTEAMTFAKDPAPDPANYPLLAATVGIEGASIKDVASIVLQTAAKWTSIAASIETARFTAKAAIDNAKTVDDAVAAFNAVKW